MFPEGQGSILSGRVRISIIILILDRILIPPGRQEQVSHREYNEYGDSNNDNELDLHKLSYVNSYLKFLEYGIGR